MYDGGVPNGSVLAGQNQDTNEAKLSHSHFHHLSHSLGIWIFILNNLNDNEKGFLSIVHKRI